MSSNNKRLTNEIVDLRLIDDKKSIKRVGNYVNAHTKIDWKCITCDHIWSAIPNNILKNNSSGCPTCFGNVKYTNADIDHKIKDKNLSRVSNYINYDTNITWKCVVCLHIWDATPNNVIGKNSGCPICSQIKSGMSKSLGQKFRVLKILADKKIDLVGKYTKVIDKHFFKCVVCKHEWQTSINNIVNSDTGCPSCVGLMKLTNESVDKRLLLRDDTIHRIDNIVNAKTKCTWRCTKGHEWQALPDSVLNFGTGCPVCNSGFYSKDYIHSNPEVMSSSANIYFIKFTQKTTNVHFVKIGISKHTIQQRFKAHTKNYNIETLYIKRLTLLECITLERDILYKMSQFQYIPVGKFGGRTECFIDTPEVKETILKLLE